MAARSTSRFKQKPAVPFGDFMLPILGVVALGIVVVGIRLLWAPNPPKPTVITQPRPIAQHQSAGIVAGKKAGAEDGVVTKKEKIDNVIIAQPVQRKSDSRSQTENRPGTPSGEGGDNASQKSPSQPRAARVEPKKAMLRQGKIASLSAAAASTRVCLLSSAVPTPTARRQTPSFRRFRRWGTAPWCVRRRCAARTTIA